jgi:ATPase subunit of ABC transporter with duplicated ATPase domains
MTVKAEQNLQRKRKREAQLEEIAHNMDFVRRFSANAKRSTLAQSRVKVIEKIKEQMEEEIYEDPPYVF